MKIKTYKELISFLSKKTDREKVELLGQFLLNNTECYYPKILWNDYKTLMFTCDFLYNVQKAKEKINREKIEEIRNLSGIENFKIIKLREEFLKIFNKNCKGVKENLPFERTDISWDMMSDLIKLYKIDGFYIEKNGLFKKGSNTNFTNFVKKVCDDLNLKNDIIEGCTTREHSWNLIQIDGEKLHFDIIYAMFVRDNFKTWGKKNLVPEDFLMVDEKKLLEISPRIIYKEEQKN